MSRKGIHAIPVKGVTGIRSDDGKLGVLSMVRDRAAPGSSERLNVCMNAELLPTVAAVCLSLMDPRQQGQGGRRSRTLVRTKRVEIGLANNGQVALTFQLQTGGSISFGLDCSQARQLAEALIELGDEAAGPPHHRLTCRPAAA